MKTWLNYVTPEGVVVEGVLVQDSVGYDLWIDNMVHTNPDVNFFFTVQTTDIWDEEERADAMVFVIKKKQLFGYNEPAFSWSCPFCDQEEGWDLSRTFVRRVFERHLVESHSIKYDRLKFQNREIT